MSHTTVAKYAHELRLKYNHFIENGKHNEEHKKLMSKDNPDHRVFRRNPFQLFMDA